MGEITERTFSDFIRNATDEEKEAVYMEVINDSILRQKDQMRPNNDVKPCDSGQA